MIDNIVVPQRGSGSPPLELRKAVLATSALPHREKLFYSEVKESLADYLRKLAPSPRTGIVFLDDLFYARLCSKLPEMMAKLFRRNHVMVLREVVMPLAEVPDLTVNALFFPWKKLARKIAEDLNQSKGSIPSTSVVLEAEWHSQLSLEKAIRFDCRE